MGRLTGRVAIITGAAHGIGATAARLFVEEGAAVLVTDVDEAGRETVADIGAGAAFARLDVTDERSWREAVATAERSFGPVDTLVNNAGAWTPRTVADGDRADFDLLTSVNQWGVLLGMRSVLEPMTRAGGGSIVNVASGAALRGHPASVVYGTTKWAVRGMTRSAVRELAERGIRVNALCPGPIAHTRMSDAHDPGYAEALRAGVPMRRLGEPIEVARAMLFLASDEASYITGAELAVDGGSAA